MALRRKNEIKQRHLMHLETAAKLLTLLLPKGKSMELGGEVAMHKVTLLNLILLRGANYTRDIILVHSTMNHVFNIGLALNTVTNT